MRHRLIMRFAIGGSALTLAMAVASCEAATSSLPIAQQSQEASPEAYRQHTVIASRYEIGEKPSKDNAYISNMQSAWDGNAVTTFGGVDRLNRTFRPKHNTYYFALPAAEFDEKGLIPGAREASPWRSQISTLAGKESLFKGRWAKITKGNQVVYAQWQDVGPIVERDYSYVFGMDAPMNADHNGFGLKAGIDLSPDAAATLGFTDGGTEVIWRFVDAQDVPEGPWNSYPQIDNIIRWNQR